MRFTQQEISSNCIPFQKALELLKFTIDITLDPVDNDILISGESKMLKIKFKHLLGRELLCGFDALASIKFTIMKNLQLEELLSVQVDVSDDTPQWEWLINDNLKQLGTI